MMNLSWNGTHRKRHQRRGATAVQVTVVLAAITVAIVLGVTQIGSLSQTQMSRTATDVGDPSSLVGRFGNSSSSSSGGSGNAGSTGSSSESGSGSTGSTGGSGGSSSSGSSGSGDSGSSGGSGSLCP